MVTLINLYKKPLDKQIINFYIMMKDKYKGKNVLQIIYRKMEDEDKSLVDIMKHSNIQEYEKV